MDKYQELIKKSEKAGYEFFWLGPTELKQIHKLELLLGLKLPQQYIDFLTIYGGGGVIESELSGIEENDASNDNGGTVYGDTLIAREEYNLPEDLAVIFYKYDEICWCIDTKSQYGSDCSIVNYDLFNQNVTNKLASDFHSFFKEYLSLRT